MRARPALLVLVPLVLLVLLAGLAGCSGCFEVPVEDARNTGQADAPELPLKDDARARLAKFATVRLTTDLSSLSDAEKREGAPCDAFAERATRATIDDRVKVEAHCFFRCRAEAPRPSLRAIRSCGGVVSTLRRAFGLGPKMRSGAQRTAERRR